LLHVAAKLLPTVLLCRGLLVPGDWRTKLKHVRIRAKSPDHRLQVKPASLENRHLDGADFAVEPDVETIRIAEATKGRARNLAAT
jgi:hypothetical protein